MSSYNINRYPLYKYRVTTKELWSIFGEFVPEKDVAELFKKLDAFRSSETWEEPVDEGKESKLIPVKAQKIKAVFQTEKGDYVYYNLEIKQSTIEKAGMGVFASEDLPEGICAQYIGIPKSEEGYNPYYSWAIFPYNHTTGVAYRDGVESEVEETEDESEEESEKSPKKYFVKDDEVHSEGEGEGDTNEDLEAPEESEDAGSEEDSEGESESLADSDEEDDIPILYIDPSDPKTGNWTRTVNCNLDLDKNNIEVVQKFDHIYYKTMRPIKKGEELFCDYGEEYRLVNIESSE